VAVALVYEDDATGWRAMQAGDLPASGVSAATYGDSTHVGQFAVSAKGIVTSASNVAISAGAGTISDITSTGGTITVGSPTGPTTNVDLPASGVTATTYGDATHVGSFTVNAEGVLTAASAVAIAGGSANLTVLFDSTLGANAASIDTGANGIAQTAAHLLIVALLRTSEAVVISTGNWTFNGDTGTNYDRQTMRARGPTQTSGAAAGTANVSLNYPGASDTASHFGGSFMAIPCYRQTTAHKWLVEMGGWADTTTTNSEAHITIGNWRNTTAINQITVTAGSGNLLAGSRLTIYGSG